MDPYASFRAEEMILRDYLAADRTVLANERTLLSYTRTAIALAGGAAALLHFFDTMWVQMVGWTLVPFAVATLGIGFQRYLSLKKRIDRVVRMRREPDPGA